MKPASFLFILTSGFLIGVCVRSFASIGWTGVVFLWFVASVCVLLGTKGFSPRKPALASALFLLCCSIGIARMHVAVLVDDGVLTPRLNSAVTLEGIVFEDPDIREKNVRVVLKDVAFVAANTSQMTDARVLVSLPAHSEISYGDHVRVAGILTIPEPFDAGSGRLFAYPEYLAKDGIGYVFKATTSKVLDHDGGTLFYAGILAIKHAYIKGLAAVLPEPYAGFGSGITIGDKRSVGAELTKTFQTVGLMHVVVLSGYNITVVIAVLLRLVSSASRSVQFAVSGGVALFFALISGGASSAVRAGAMACAVTIARGTGRIFDASRVLAAVGVVMVAWNPFILAFDPGFQLSVLATLGLVLFGEPFSRRITCITERFALREIVSTTLATQLLVLSLLLYQNGLVPLLALPANILVLMVMPWAMLFACIAAFAGMVLGSWGIVIAAPAYVLLWYCIAVAKLLAAMPFSSVTIDWWNGWFLVTAYLVCACGGWYVWRTKKAGGS